MPRIGVYPAWDDDLNWFIQETCECVSGSDLLRSIVLEPLLDIRRQAHVPGVNKLILRERLRRWTERVETDIGSWIPLPTWDDLMGEEWEDDCPLWDYFADAEDQWIIAGDDSGMAYQFLDEIFDMILEGCSPFDVTNLILKWKGDEPADLIILDDQVYVVASSQVELHKGLECPGEECVDLADALLPGIHPTYVITEKMSNEYIEWLKH